MKCRYRASLIQKFRFNLPYWGKLAVLFCLLLTIAFTAVALIVGSNIYRHMNQSIQSQSVLAVEYLSYAVNQFFDSVKELTLLPLYDKKVLEAMEKHTGSENSLFGFEDRYLLTSYINSFSYDKRVINNVSLYLMDGNYISYKGFMYKWKDNGEEWIRLCNSDPRRTFIISSDGSIVVCRAIEKPLKGTLLGYLFISLKSDAVPALLAEIKLPADTNVYIFNDLGECIYPFDVDVSMKQLTDKADKHYYYRILNSGNTRLSVAVQMSTEALNAEARALYIKLINVLILSLVVAWLLIIMLSRRLTKPILNLKEKMELVGKGRFDTRMMVRSGDEIGQLEAMFNSMTQSVETLIHEVYEASIAGREAQISALQSQINPHFLYNTLETINMMAVAAGDYDISEVVSNLGQMMRYCVSNEKHFAALKDELSFLRAYHDIQRLRHSNLNRLDINCPDEYMHIEVPKLLLQPFEENVVQHALGDSEVDILLHVAAKSSDLIITIENNGLPFTQQSKEQLKHRLHEAKNMQHSDSGKGYGLANVHRRLGLIFGDGYGIELDDSCVNGARFIIRLNMKERKDVRSDGG